MRIEIFSRYLSFTICFSAVSCSGLWTSESEKSQEPVVVSSTESASKPATNVTNSDHKSEAFAKSDSASEQSKNIIVGTTGSEHVNADDDALKFTRILARLDSMDAELRRQREKLRLLEQGLLTGIAPDDLKQRRQDPKIADDDRSPKKKPIVREDLSRPSGRTGDAPLAKPNLDDLTIPEREVSGDGGADSPVMAKIQLAKEHYQGGRFGLAIAELAGVSREHGDKVQDGAVKFWLGRSYLGLKEYQTARGEFESYIKGWPTGEYVASARLDLAKAFVGLGLRERARSELRRVIKDFEGEEASEMASAELKNMQGSL